MTPARKARIVTPAPAPRLVYWSSRDDRQTTDPSAEATARNATPHAAHAPVDPATPGPILVVDDDTGLREALVSLLEDEGYPVVAASDGRAALAAIERQRPSLVLLDMRMPGLNGWDVAHALAQRGITLPIVVMTAARDAAAWAAEIGAAAFLAKPFDLPELLEIVERTRQ